MRDDRSNRRVLNSTPMRTSTPIRRHVSKAFCFLGTMAMLFLGSTFSAKLQAQESGEIDPALIERLIDNLDDSDKDKRREAALRLSEMGPAAAPAVPALIEALKDSDQQVWFFSITAIARIGAKAEAAIPVVMEGLDARRRYDDQVWYRHAFALGKIGEASLPAIREGLKDNSSKVRSGCVKALSWIGEPAHELIPDLVQALGDDSGRVRQHAAETLGAFGKPSVEPVLTRLEQESIEQENELLALINALYWIGQDAAPAGDTLVALAESDRSDEIRSNAVKALDRIQPFPADKWAGFLTGLLTRVEATETPDLEQELRNAILLIRNPARNVIPELEKLTMGDSQMVAEKAATTLGEYYEEALDAAPTLIQAIQHWGLSEEYSVFVEALTKIGSRVVPFLLEPLDKTPLGEISEQHWSLRTLGSIRPSTALVDTLSDTILNGQPSSQYAALSALKSWIPALKDENEWGDSTEGPVRSATLASLKSNTAEVQTMAWKVVPQLSWPGVTNEEALLGHFSANLKNGSQSVKLAALDAIRDVDLNLGPVIPLLMEQLNSGNEATRIRVVQALGDFGQVVNETAFQSLIDQLDDFVQKESTESKANEEWGVALVDSLAQIVMPEQASELLNQCAQMTGSSRKSLRVAALNAMGDLGPLSVSLLPVALEKTDDSESDVRLAALKALTRITRQSRTLVPALTAGIQDESLEIRMFATEEIGRFGREAQGPAEPLLFAVLDDGEVRKTALDTLRQIRTEALPLLEKALEHEDASVRLFACETLGFLGPRAESAIPALEKRLRDDYSFVRRQAQAALEKIKR